MYFEIENIAWMVGNSPPERLTAMAVVHEITHRRRHRLLLTVGDALLAHTIDDHAMRYEIAPRLGGMALRMLVVLWIPQTTEASAMTEVMGSTLRDRLGRENVAAILWTHPGNEGAGQ